MSGINLNAIDKALYNNIYNNKPTPNFNTSTKSLVKINNIIEKLLSNYTYENRYYLHQIIQKIWMIL